MVREPDRISKSSDQPADNAYSPASLRHTNCKDTVQEPLYVYIACDLQARKERISGS